MTQDDARLLPAAAVTWILAVLGIRSGTATAVAALLVLIALAAAALPVLAGNGRARALAAHAGLVLLLGALLVPALRSAEISRQILVDAAAAGETVELELTLSSTPAPPSSGPAWSREGLQVMARTARGTIQHGRHSSHSGSRIPVLLRASAPEAAQELGAVGGGDRVQVRGTVRDGGDLLVLQGREVRSAPHSGLRGALDAQRRELRAQLRAATAGLPQDEGALVRGMATGSAEGMSHEAEESMRRGGITHLVAVSGTHIGLVLAAVLVPLLLLGVGRRPRILLGALTVAAYAWLVGEAPSVQRALTMAAPLLIARLVGVRGSPLAALSMTVALWAVLDPVTAASAGFMLSALATAAILLLSRPVAQGIRAAGGERIPPAAALVIAVPLVAQLACTPLLVTFTPEISLWAVTVNMAVAPLVGPTTLLGLLALVIALVWPPLAGVIAQGSGGGAHLILLTARAFDALPGARIPVPEGTLGMLGMILLPLAAAAAWALRRRRATRWVLAAALVIALSPALGQRLATGGREDWMVAACAVGQGDAVLLRPPAESGGEDPPTVLVDTGPDPELLTRCLDLLGVRSIELLILTHPHADHVGGRQALTGPRVPAAQWICPLEGASQDALAQAAPQAVTSGHVHALGTLELEVLWPPSAQAAEQAHARERGSGEGDAANDCSVTVHAQWDDSTSMVLLGDLEPAAQADLAALLADDHPAWRGADLVKVAHHGSRFQDPRLYESIAAQLAIITVGEENTFGHPTRQTLDLLASQGSAVVRTDRDGTVILPVADPAAPRSVGPAR